MDNPLTPNLSYFTGSKVILKPFEREDLELSMEWNNDEAINAYNGSRFPNSVLEQTEWYEKTQKDKTKKRLIICSRETGEKAGMVSLFNINERHRNAEIGVYLAPAFQKKGFAREAISLLTRFAFMELGMHKLYATIFSFNTGSIKLFESAGFVHEYTKKAEIFTNGRYFDVLVYAQFTPVPDKTSKD
jgi:RimJ/RimL family protein N-acetyltransferase